MTTKLTLTVEKSTIDRAKRFAKNNGRSLSDMVSCYLEHVTGHGVSAELDLPADLKKLYGALKIPLSLNHKREIRKISSLKVADEKRFSRY